MVVIGCVPFICFCQEQAVNRNYWWVGRLLFGGSPLRVSGPAVGLFVIVTNLLAKGRDRFLGKVGPAETLESEVNAYSLVVLVTSVILAGLLQVVAEKLRFGQWFRAVSPAVRRCPYGIIQNRRHQRHARGDRRFDFGEPTRCDA